MGFGIFLSLMFNILSTSAQNRTIQAIYVSINLDLLTAFYIFFPVLSAAYIWNSRNRRITEGKDVSTLA